MGEAMIASVEDDGSGQIGFDEFLRMMTNKILNRDPEEELIKAFKLMEDPDTPGAITLKSLKKIAQGLGERMTDEELAEQLQMGDASGNGDMSQAEFVKVLKRTGM